MGNRRDLHVGSLRVETTLLYRHGRTNSPVHVGVQADSELRHADEVKMAISLPRRKSTRQWAGEFTTLEVHLPTGSVGLPERQGNLPPCLFFVAPRGLQ